MKVMVITPANAPGSGWKELSVDLSKPGTQEGTGPLVWAKVKSMEVRVRLADPAPTGVFFVGAFTFSKS